MELNLRYVGEHRLVNKVRKLSVYHLTCEALVIAGSIRVETH